MELKTYQQAAINDLKDYLSRLGECMDMDRAFREYWLDKGVHVGLGAIDPYQDILSGVPNVCFKVPTGGGKTFMACASVRPICDALPELKAKSVVWLVPSDAILEQTLKNLKNPSHPYRQRLNADFGGRVEVYSKQELLNGQNFNPTSVTEQLSVMVLSFDSFRSNKKEGLKAFQENSNLAPFSRVFGEPDSPVENADSTALFQVVNQLNPLVIVDESHHARSKLSIDTLKDFNPCFVLDLTATPRKESNLISITDAAALKLENMVKLPVILYNRASKEDVLLDAIDLRNSLEAQAIEDEKAGGSYIRPIVLFQAQPKGKEDATTFEKLREQLVSIGIPEDQIAIKTADVNELKKVDLLSHECPIRYIITVNALKEGWDCPFAYVLATLANRTSQVDVEQILGRVLRQPHARRSPSPNLNISYVLTSSADFQQTIKNIIKGLNDAGFSKDEYRVGDDAEAIFPGVAGAGGHEQASQTLWSTSDSTTDMQTEDQEVPEFLLNSETINDMANRLSEKPEMTTPQLNNVSAMLATAATEAEQYDDALMKNAQSGMDELPSEIRDSMNAYQIKPEFRDSIDGLRIPQFYLEEHLGIFAEGEFSYLDAPTLDAGFQLIGKPYDIDFAHVDSEVVRIDIESGSKVPKVMMMSSAEQEYLRSMMENAPDEKKRKICVDAMLNRINKSNEISQSELANYLTLIVDNMDKDELADLEKAPHVYARKVEAYIKDLLVKHRMGTFSKWIATDKIVCQPSYQLPEVVRTNDANDMYTKTLYEAEGKMNGFEERFALRLSAQENVLWWHRNPERGDGFCINGYINHYPDFIIMLKNGKVVLAETKGEMLKNDDSRQKIELGAAWTNATGKEFRYCMVFDEGVEPLSGAYNLNSFLELIAEL